MTKNFLVKRIPLYRYYLELLSNGRKTYSGFAYDRFERDGTVKQPDLTVPTAISTHVDENTVVITPISKFDKVTRRRNLTGYVKIMDVRGHGRMAFVRYFKDIRHPKSATERLRRVCEKTWRFLD